MRQQDVDAMNKFFIQWKNEQIKTILVHSGNGEEQKILNAVFPNIWIDAVTRSDWDFNNKSKLKYDLILVCNTFMMSKNPDLWFGNVLASCKYLWIQDSIRGRRMENEELGDDGDSVRYCKPPEILARIDKSYDLNKLNNRIINFTTYETPGPTINGQYYDSLHFLLNLKGDL